MGRIRWLSGIRWAIAILFCGSLAAGCAHPRTSPAATGSPSPADATAPSITLSPTASPTLTVAGSTMALNLMGQYGGTPRALAVDGRRVYFGVGMHLAMADVGGATPRLVAESPTLPGAVRVVAVQGRWVYVGAGPQLAVFAASPGDAPLQPITSVPLPGPVSALAVAERYAWAVAGQSLVVFDLAEPAAPRQAGMLALPAPSHSIALRGPYAYLAAADGGLRVLDLSTF